MGSVKGNGVDGQMERTEPMSVGRITGNDAPRTIGAASVVEPGLIDLTWSDGTQATVDICAMLENPTLAALRDPALFAKATIGDWGHSIVWPGEIEIGADRLWAETLSATQREDTRTFLEWRQRHGLSLSKAADALGLARRTVAYYSNGEKRVPRPVLLACRGWEVEQAEAA
jgi:hypothetical protein